MDAFINSDDFIDALAQRLRRPPPGPNSQNEMAPELAFGRHQGPLPAVVRRAAVMAVFLRRNGRRCLLLTRRPEHLPDHGGQVCLPGGSIEPGESVREAALRELAEELGPPPETVRVLGELTPLYVFGSNFWVSPWVGVLPDDYALAPNPAEVASLIELPAFRLIEPTIVRRTTITRGEVSFEAPCFHWSGDDIWGATSMILAELRAAIRQTAEGKSPHRRQDS